MKRLPVLGAVAEGSGVRFCVFSANARAVELCIYERLSSKSRVRGGSTSGNNYQEVKRIPVKERSGDLWHVYVPGIKPGTAYGYRVHGAYSPSQGLRFNSNKLLLDPYARGVVRVPGLDGDYNEEIDRALLGYSVEGASDGDLSTLDSGACAPLAVYLPPLREKRENSNRPYHPLESTVIYEAHVKGLTALHPRVPVKHRGKYLGVCSKAVVKHLKSLGVTAIELLPVLQSMTERPLLLRQQRNYWGYSPLAFLAPDIRYATIPDPLVAREEFRQMVRTLHDEGIEVILDVVYNHSCESAEDGFTVSFRGLDNSSYYRLQKTDPRLAADSTGCGNSLQAENPFVLQLIMDSLRFWVTEMDIDGFRFDLASSLARVEGVYSRTAPLLTAIHQDPILSRVKLIAESWDTGPNGYNVGDFPAGWSEWNGQYREEVRDFWRGVTGRVGNLASRISGSSDIFAKREPAASINFVTAHDGFTLRDLVSYNEKHNEANGESNQDGESFNRSWNCGVEGGSTEDEIVRLRYRQRLNIISTLLLSAGVPMLLAGDEIGHTQRGNNNSYCHDNELTWLPWEGGSTQGRSAQGRSMQSRSTLGRFSKGEESALLSEIAELLEIRKAIGLGIRREFFRGDGGAGNLQPEMLGKTVEAEGGLQESRLRDIVWCSPLGHELGGDDWSSPHLHTLGMLLPGVYPNSGTATSTQPNAAYYVVFHGGVESIELVLPSIGLLGSWKGTGATGRGWESLFSSAGKVSLGSTDPVQQKVLLLGRSVTVLVARG